MESLHEKNPLVNHLVVGNPPFGNQKLTQVKNSRREFFRAKALEHDESEAGYAVQAQAERRTVSQSHTALAALTAELGFSDKSYRLLSVLCGISNGHHDFKTTFAELYNQLRRYDPKLKDENGQLASKAGQTVRRYFDALLKDQARTGVALTEIQTGTMGKDGTHYPTSVSLTLLDHLDVVNQRTKASPSYSRNSAQIRKVEARKLAAALLKQSNYKQPEKPPTNPIHRIRRLMKQTAGMFGSTIKAMKAENYTDEAIRAWFLASLQDEDKAVLFGSDIVSTEILEHGAGAGLDSVLTPHHVPETVSDPETNFDTLPDLQTSENTPLSEQANVDNLHFEAVGMVEVFETVGADAFDLTTTNEQGMKMEFVRSQSADYLKAHLPELLRQCERAELNVIVRPHLSTGAGCRLVQLDDLDRRGVEKVRPFAFLVLETSPANFQAWVAIEQASDDIARRLKKGIGADSTASGATRIAGSRNFKPKHAPAYPYVRVELVSPGRKATIAELDQAALLAPKESSDPAPPRHAPIASNTQPRRWPSYQRCLVDSPKARNHDGPDRSHADFEFCLFAIDRGWTVEATAQKLIIESEKAERKGYRYALHTARNAANVVASRKG